MPELPEVQALSEALAAQLTGAHIDRAELGGLSALKTYEPPFDALAGARLLGTGRIGKFLVLDLVDAQGEPLHLVVHLSRAGWLHWRSSAPKAPLRPGKSPVAVRLVWAGGELSGPLTLDITEAGTQKRLAVYLVPDPAEVPGVARLGPDALAVGEEQLAQLLAEAGGRHLKTVLRDQSVIAGIGNAYSDEILHRARLSPYAAADGLDPDQVERLHAGIQEVLTQAVDASKGTGIGDIKQEKRVGLAVHGRAGQKCPECGDTIGQVRLADSSFEYCPTCQTGGKHLADRRMSRLLK